MASESESSDDSSDSPVRQIFIESRAGLFSFDGYSLEFQDHPYTRDVARYIPRPEARRAEEGAVAVPQARHDNKPREWWQSQCAFRGLRSDGTVEDLQHALRGHEEDPVADDVLDVLVRARKELKAQRRRVREYNWLHILSAEEKATKDPRRYLEETFPAGSHSKETVLLTTHVVASIQETVRELGLRCGYTHAPMDGEAVLQMAKYWVVIGQDGATVTEQVGMIERQAERLRRDQEEGQQELRRRNKRARTRKKEIEEAAAKGRSDWDVTGWWNISCPRIEEGWEVESLGMKIYVETTQTTERGPRMCAEFDFGVVRGAFHFEGLKEDFSSASSRPAHGGDDDNDEEKEEGEVDEQEGGYGDDETSDSSSDIFGDEDELDNYDMNHDDDDIDDNDEWSPTPEAFHFTPIAEHSPKQPTWNHHSRDVEPGEGVSEVSSEPCSITFTGRRGRALKGTIRGSVLGDGAFTFTGVKVGGLGEAEFFG